MSELSFVDRRAGRIPAAASSSSGVSTLYRREPPVSRETLAEWQRQIDAAIPVTEKLSRLLVLWEPGDVWCPVQRLLLWQCVDPRYHEIEPWILAELKGPSPRSTGHPCFPGYCLCDVKRSRWIDGASRYIDLQTWELYQETGLYGSRWWVIQGSGGGHRKRWEVGGLESTVARMKGYGDQPPQPGDLPYAPFDSRVIERVMAERNMRVYMRAYQDKAQRLDSLSDEEEVERVELMRVLWDRTGEQVDALWQDGADLLPRYFEETLGRVPSGTPSTVSEELVQQRFISGG